MTTLCGWIATACSRAGNPPRSTPTTKDSSNHEPPSRGGIDPQAPNWSLEPAGSQSETGPTQPSDSGGPVVCSRKGNPRWQVSDSKIRGQRWRILVGSVALGAAALGLSSCGVRRATTAATDEAPSSTAVVECSSGTVTQGDVADVVTLRGEGARRRAARHPRGLHRADGLNRPVRRAVRSWGRRGSSGAGWETGARGQPRAPALSRLRACGSSQSRSITVTASPAATPSPSGSSASPLAAALDAERVALLRPHAGRDVAAVDHVDDDAVEVQLAVDLAAASRRRRWRRTSRRNGCGVAHHLRSAGRANSSKLTNDDTGLPGSPNTGVPRSIAEAQRLRGLDRDLVPVDA